MAFNYDHNFYVTKSKRLVYLDNGVQIISINLENYNTCYHSRFTTEQMVKEFKHIKITAKEAVELLRLDIP